MNDVKYIELDVHQATISAAVLDSNDKLVMECVLETKAAIVLQFMHGLRGSLHVTFEEGTCATWLHEIIGKWLDGFKNYIMRQQCSPNPPVRMIRGCHRALVRL